MQSQSEDPADPEKTTPTWPVDWCHGIAHIGAAILLVVFRDVAPNWLGWTFWSLFVAAAAFSLSRFDRRWNRKQSAVARMVFTALAIPMFFTQLGSLVPFVNPAEWEKDLYDIDLVLSFGINPLEAIDRLSHPWLTEYLQWVYDYYYFIPVILGAVVIKEKGARELAKMVFAIALCIYLSYVGYFLIPATGPNINAFALYHFDAPVRGVFLASELRETLFAIEKIKENCFPSGHTAVSLLSLLLARHFCRRAVPVLWPLVASLIFSTLYLRYHYLVDVLAGIILAVVTAWAALKLHERFERRYWSDHGNAS